MLGLKVLDLGFRGLGLGACGGYMGMKKVNYLGEVLLVYLQGCIECCTGDDKDYIGIVWEVYEPLSQRLVSPLIALIVPNYVIPHITPFKEFRLWYIRSL